MNKRNIVCTICARKNSRGLKNKNLLKINGLTLIEISINHAIDSKLFKSIVVSSDSEKIKKICSRYPVIFIKRKKRLSTDKSGKIEVIKDAINQIEKEFYRKVDVICDLDVTSPIRKSADITKAYNIFNLSNTNLFSVISSKKNPYFNMIEKKNNRYKLISSNLKNFLTRQSSPKVYDLNASIYFWSREYLFKRKLINKNTKIYIMKNYCVDIDDKYDFLNVKNLIENNYV